MTCTIFTLTTVETSDSVILNCPFRDSLNNRLDKQLKQFNLWADYKLHDEGIAGQPLNFEGIERGKTYGVCFPLCFPICFNQVIEITAQTAQEKFAKIHSWMENHYTITLSAFGNCFDATFIIKNFTVQSMKHPSSYLWKLSLEKVSD